MPAAAAAGTRRVPEPVEVEAAPPDEPEEPPEGPRLRGSGLMKPFVVLALPGMYLFYKYNQYRREQRELSRRRVTERELQHLHHKIDKLLTKLEENEPEMASSQEDECVICVNAKATMQTAPCGHRVVCRRCFVKTIQMAVSQRLLPLRCVICRAKILRLKQTLGPRDSSSYSVSGKSWVLPQSASDYNVGASVPVGTAGPSRRWASGNVPASASLYSMSSGSSSISGVSSVSSSSSSSSGSYGSSTMGKPWLRPSSGAYLKKSQKQMPRPGFQEYQDSMRVTPEEDEIRQDNQRLPPIKEFQRDFKFGKTSTRLRCAQKIVTQLESTSSPRVSSSQVYPSTSTSSSHGASTSGYHEASSSKTVPTNKRSSGTTPKKLTVSQEVQKMKKEKERQKEREKAEKARLKEEQKAEKARLKEAKKLAKEEKKREKKEAKARKKEAEQALLANIK